MFTTKIREKWRRISRREEREARNVKENDHGEKKSCKDESLLVEYKIQNFLLSDHFNWTINSVPLFIFLLITHFEGFTG